MKATLLALGAVAGANAQVTIAAILNNAAVVAANAGNDAQACSTANDLALGCANLVGGVDGLLTASPSDLLECACCESGTAVSDVFSDCSTYMVSESPALSSLFDAYRTVYSACSAFGTCTGEESSTERSSTTRPSSTPTITSASGFDELTSFTGGITDVPTSLPDACYSMVGFFDSCVSESPGFSTMPYGSQAPCYCCTSSRRSIEWTDELDSWAADCADWAVTAAPSSIYDVASLFAGFCENFSDACDDATTTARSSSSETSETDTSSTPADTGSADSSDATQTSDPETEDAGARLRISAMAALVAIAATFATL